MHGDTSSRCDDEDYALSVRAHRLCNFARVGVRVIVLVVDVVCVMLVLIARVVVQAVDIQFS